MNKLVVLRRRKLGMSSARGIVKYSKNGIRWTRNDFPEDEQPKPDEITIRWGCTSTVATKNVVNTARAIHKTNDKGGFRKLCAEHGLSPRTWLDYRDIPLDIIQNGVIVRPNHHSQGRNLYFCKTIREAEKAMLKCPGGYISEYIPKVAEYRVYIVSGRVIAVAEKTPENPEDIAWNHAKGGTFNNVRWGNWPISVIKYSIEAHKLSGLDFSGVDVMVDDRGDVYIIEINTAPSLTTEYRQQCFAKAFDWIAEFGKGVIPINPLGANHDVEEGWKQFIHPAISEKAVL